MWLSVYEEQFPFTLAFYVLHTCGRDEQNEMLSETLKFHFYTHVYSMHC
jgi:hypothetical protein